MRIPSLLLRRFLIVAFAVAATPSLPSAAATLTDLYTVTVAPDPAAADQREAAMQAAMEQLLIRVTGSRTAPLEPALRPLITAADQYLASYGSDRQGQAVVGFSRGRVERALAELGQPVWGPERPLTVLWIAIDDGAGGRSLLGAGEPAEAGAPTTPRMAELKEAVREEIVAAAEERGLPIEWPLLDLQDLGAVEFLDVWGGFEEKIVAASARYRADAVLIGRVRPGTFGTEVEWLFVHGIERQALPVSGVRDGLDVAADRYAADL